MVLRATVTPKPSLGEKCGRSKLVVPNQAMSLQYILERFTRGEAVSVGHDVVFDDDSDVDLEKLAHADLVDKAEFVEAQKEKQKRFEQQERAKKKAAEKAAYEAVLAEQRQKVEAEMAAQAAKGKVNP